MCDFKRSPSKVWWASESLEWREISKSPGSQDSGFSDTETSPTFQTKNPPPAPPADIFKPSPRPEKPQNLSSNYKEKTTPDKTIPPQLDSPKTSRFTKNSPKVSRSLFKNRQNNHSNQYSRSVIQETTHSSSSIINNSEIPLLADSYSTSTTFSKTLPNIINAKDIHTSNYHFPRLNQTAPSVLEEVRDEEDLYSLNDTHNSLASDSESDLECLFDSPLNSPTHTSTPKASLKHIMHKLPLNLFLKRQQERLRASEVIQEELICNRNVNQWMTEIKQTYEPECMTTLQAKSIAGELNHKVSQMASQASASIQSVLKQSSCIESEYKTLNNESKYVGALAQSLAGNIVSYLERHSPKLDRKIMQLHDEVRKAKSDEIGLNHALTLFNHWQLVHADILQEEVKSLITKLEHPCSELDLRATITAITFIALRNDSVVELFTRNDVIPILLTLCDKCEGSSLRSLLLRALTIMCSNAFSVRQIEKYCGVQTVCDTLEDESRPEPERSEAVALLAQVTAPWIEDNHYIRGLEEYSRKLVKSLTKLALATKCCQNLLLCAAALANLSAMDAKCVKYMVGARTCGVLLDAVRRRGPCASVYLLEQVATLVANAAASGAARKQLGEIKAARVLLCFLRPSGVGGEVEKRVQQKSIIALSRLCSDRGAAAQVVEAGGVEKLVKMCREKEERFDNDAVLVATLATLRKIADACGSGVIGMEDAQELVEPKLLDSFLAYSTQSESYV